MKTNDQTSVIHASTQGQEVDGHSAVTVKPTKAAKTTKKNVPVNGHANGLTSSSSNLRDLLAGLQAMRAGDFNVRLPGDWIGLEGKIADTFNEIIAANQQMAQELARIGEVVGRKGKTRDRKSVV